MVKTETLPRTDVIKDLGVLFDLKLTFNADTVQISGDRSA